MGPRRFAGKVDRRKRTHEQVRRRRAAPVFKAARVAFDQSRQTVAARELHERLPRRGGRRRERPLLDDPPHGVGGVEHRLAAELRLRGRRVPTGDRHARYAGAIGEQSVPEQVVRRHPPGPGRDDKAEEDCHRGVQDGSHGAGWSRRIGSYSYPYRVDDRTAHFGNGRGKIPGKSRPERNQPPAKARKLSLVYFWVEPDSQDLLGGGDVEPLGKRGRNVNAKPLGDFLCPAMKGVSAAHESASGEGVVACPPRLTSIRSCSRVSERCLGRTAPAALVAC